MVVFRFLQLTSIMSDQDLLGEEGCVGCGSSISGGFDGSIGDLELVSMYLSVEESRRNRWVRWSQFPACSVKTIGGFVFAGDVFSVPVAVV
ncbi:unnamed protein product [Brassica oleracea]|uniref:(rape) hypothetical protein n=1 Tax=Brassica napus TaxID=3708 RepID=A0A816QRA0_BRANA|nr:unnamed protein product [Brassica napus]